VDINIQASFFGRVPLAIFLILIQFLQNQVQKNCKAVGLLPLAFLATQTQRNKKSSNKGAIPRAKKNKIKP